MTVREKSQDRGLKAPTQLQSTRPDSDAEQEERSSSVLLALYQRQHQPLRHYLRALVGAGPPDPDDIVQAAFAKLAARHNLSDVANLPAFLWRTAQNLLISERRAAAVRKAKVKDVEDVFLSTATDVFDPERVLIAKTEVDLLTSALKSMPPKQQKILLMSRIEGLSNAEIARRLGLARSTVSEHLARALFAVDGYMNAGEMDER